MKIPPHKCVRAYISLSSLNLREIFNWLDTTVSIFFNFVNRILGGNYKHSEIFLRVGVSLISATLSKWSTFEARDF